MVLKVLTVPPVLTVLTVLTVLKVPRVLRSMPLRSIRRMRRRVLVPKVLVVLVVLAMPRAGAAQQLAAAAYVDQPIKSVTVTIEGRPTLEPAVLDAIQMKTNAPLAMSDVRETISHLFSFGRFADVQVDAEAADGGVALRFELKPIHTVTKVDFRGTLGLAESTLRDRMRERFGETPPITRAADVASGIQQLYEERGYLAATVRAAPPIIEHDPDRATLVFDITAGRRTTIARSTVIGQPLSSAGEIQSRLQIQPGKPYQPAVLQERLDELVTSMRERRYYEASGTVVTPAFSEDRTEVELTVDVQRGPLVTVQFAGDPIPKDKIDELVPVEREGSVDEDLLEDSARRIADYLRQEGYWKAEVNPPVRREAPGELTIVFTVNRGRIYRLGPGGVEVTGAQSIPADELKALLRLKPGDLFVASQLGAIEGAIRQIYRTRGFATADISTAVNETAPGLVTPVIAVKEGPRVTIGDVAITGNQAVPVERLRAVLLLARDQPYHGSAVVRDRNALLNFYLDEGYASADVTVAPVMPVVTGDAARADVTFRIVEGPQTIVEHIFITGNLRTRLNVIQRELQFEEGQPLGLAALTESRRRLSALGLFRRIQISAISHGDPRSQDVVITVEEAPQTSIGYGGGLQVDRLLREQTDGGPREEVELAPRGFFEVGRRNVGGHNRSLNLYSRLSLRPSPDPASSNPFGFSEYRVIGTFRDPRALGRLGELTATAAIEQGVRTGFNFSRKGFNTELGHRLTPTLRGSVRYSFGTTRIFDSQLLEDDDELTIDRVFPQVRLSAFSVAASRDTRDDPLEPQRGLFLTADGSLAARAIGSEVGFTKTYLQGFFYRNLGKPNLVLAGGARLGLAHGFLRLVETVDENENPVTIPVSDLPASERFFAGGETTIRGFSLDSVGTPETLTSSGFPQGGNGGIVLNAELRFPVYRDVGAVAFVDGGNVFANASDLDLTRLRGSVGFGARYRSPIGPIRVDLGFKLDRRVVNNQLERRYEIHFSIGQAF